VNTTLLVTFHWHSDSTGEYLIHRSSFSRCETVSLFSLDFDWKAIIMKIMTKKEKIESNLICPNCSHKISRTKNGFYCENCNSLYPILNGIPILISAIDERKRRESEYHSWISNRYRDLHKMDTYRNIYYHHDSLKPITNLKHSSKTLELGCGTGYDAAYLLSKGLTVVATDISIGQVTQAKKELSKNKFKGNAFLYVADAENIPFADKSFDAAYITAALHHLQHPRKALMEMKRCIKDDSFIVVAIEPNRYEWLVVIGFLFSIFKKTLYLFSSSAALIARKEKTEHWREPNLERTFSICELTSLIEHSGLSIIKVKAIWFTLGFVHWFTTLLSKMSKRNWYISRDAERIFILIDNFLSTLPLINLFCCNWTVWCRKKETKNLNF